MQRWRTAFSALDIAHLRSPTVHHPDDDPWAFVDYVRGDESGTFRDGQYVLPATTSFHRFCDEVTVLCDLEHVVHPSSVEHINVGGRGAGAVLDLADGTQISARHVVVATNPRLPHVPTFAAAARHAAPAVVRLASEVDLQGTLPSSVLVVGGGLTGAQLALGAHARGVRVHYATRGRIRVQPFDVDAGWLGPRHLDAFHAEPDLAARRAMLTAARPFGTMPGFAAKELRRAATSGLALHEGAEVVGLLLVDGAGAGFSGASATLGDGARVQVDEVWLATGTTVDVLADPLCASLQAMAPIPIHGGLPAIDAGCRWPGTEVFLVGSCAALRVGPAAAIMFGHRQAAVRVCAELLPGRRCLPGRLGVDGGHGRGRRSSRGRRHVE